MLQHPQGQLTMLPCPARGTGGGTAQAPHTASSFLDAGSAIAACPVGSALVFSQNSIPGLSLQLHPDPQPGLPNCWSLAGPFLRSHPGHPPGFLFGWSLTMWRPFGEGVVSGFCNFGLFFVTEPWHFRPCLVFLLLCPCVLCFVLLFRGLILLHATYFIDCVVCFCPVLCLHRYPPQLLPIHTHIHTIHAPYSYLCLQSCASSFLNVVRAPRVLPCQSSGQSVSPME